MKNKLFILITFLQVFGMFAQEKCGFESQQSKLFANDPSAKKAYQDAEYKLLFTDVQQFLERNAANSATTVYEIPIVVHLMNDGTTPLRTNAEIINWVDNCNKFYDTTFGGDWLTVAQGGTIIPFRLVLAKRSPSCTVTNGIIQVNVTATYPQYASKGCNSDNTDGVSPEQLRNLSRWDPQIYYNAYIVNTFDSVPVSTTGGLQGYASFPTNPDNSYDTFMKAWVVIDSNDQTTLPHEFAHSMGLNHPFKNGSAATCPTATTPTFPILPCNVDNDLVCDTPSTKSLLGVSPLPTNSDTNPCDTAGWNNVQFNVMNYTITNKLFSAGQKNRAETFFLQNRENLTKSLGGTTLAVTPASVGATTCIPPSTPTNTGNLQSGPTKVIIGNIKNVSAASNTSNANQVFYDYTTKSCLTNAFKTTLAVSANPHTITLRCNLNPNKFSAWIDYNNNGTFDATELIVSNQNISPDIDAPFTFSIPITGVTLDTPLRLRVIGDDNDMSAVPCGQLADGQVEDYEVTITSNVLSATSFDAGVFKIFPNPSNGIYTIIANANTTVEIFDIVGKSILVQKNNIGQTTLNLSQYTAGMYMAKITNQNNETKTLKLIKQ